MQMHAKNEFLRVCDFLAMFPEVTVRIVNHLRPEYLVDLMLMLHVRGVMEPAIFGVASIEAKSNADRGLVSETFRTESPAILMAGALLSLDTLLDFKHKFVSEAAVKLMKRVTFTSKVLLKYVVCGCVLLVFVPRSDFLFSPLKDVQTLVEILAKVGSEDARRARRASESAGCCEQGCKHAKRAGPDIFPEIHLSCARAARASGRT